MAVKLKPISTEVFLRGGQSREKKRLEKELEDERKREEARASQFNIGNSLASAALAFVTSGGNPLAAAAAGASSGFKGSGKGAPSALQAGLQGVTTGVTAGALTPDLPAGAGLIEKGAGLLKGLTAPENLQKTAGFLSTVGAGEDITKPLTAVGKLTTAEETAEKKLAKTAALDASKSLVANQIQRIASADIAGVRTIMAEVRNRKEISGEDHLKASEAATKRINKLNDIKQKELERKSKEKISAEKKTVTAAKERKATLKAEKVAAEKTAKAVKVAEKAAKIEEEKTAKRESATESSRIINELKSFSVRLPTSIFGAKGEDETAVTQLNLRIKSFSNRIDRVQDSSTMSPTDKTKVVSELQRLISKMKRLILGEDVTSATTDSQAVA